MQQCSSQHLLNARVLMSLAVKFLVHSRQLRHILVYACGEKLILIMVMLNLYSDPFCHSYLFLYFRTFWSIMCGSRAASTKWGWDLKQATAMLRDARRITEGKRSTTRCIAGRRSNTDRFGQIFALRKLGDCQELCKKTEISACVGRQTDS